MHTPKPHHIPFAIFLASIFSQTLVVAGTAAKVETPYVFTDGVTNISLPDQVDAVPCHISTITVDGFGPKRTTLLDVKDGQGSITPLAEGIHVVSLGEPINKELRFLAIAPPPELNKEAVIKALPHNGEKLLGGKPFTILSMGDSVTRTGDYESMLVMLLKRATGNTNISFMDKSYPGRSVDSTVRQFDRDTRDLEPDLGLLMYGLNDQAGFVPLRAYLEQYAWVAEQLDARFQADTMFLQPTPHIAVLGANKKGTVNPPEYAFRTVGFAAAVANLGPQLNVPVARTFAAVWGEGGGTIPEAAMAMWPLYPRGHRAQFSSILESRGKGDTIHPNALGHLQIAKAVFATLNGRTATQALKITGESRWTKQGVISRISATNTSGELREGRLEAYAPTGAQIESPGPVLYSLAPGESTAFEIPWPEVRRPEDLNTFPYSRYLSEDFNRLAVMDVSGKAGIVHSVEVPFDVPGDFVAGR
jgi:lysophospholipase L1-like esterase